MPELASRPLFELANGRYAALEVLGRGGNSTVYRCLDNTTGVQRAIKIRLPGRGFDSAELLRRLDAEAEVMERLKHPRLLPVHDRGIDGAMHYVVMTLAPGGSLAAYLERHGRLSPALAARHMAIVLGAVQAAHEARVIHRDLKPDNILLDENNEPLLADFGIAKVRRDDTPTFSGATLGSLAYMAPEQRTNAHKVGPTADIYSAGATLFNLLTCNSPVDLFACPPDSPRWDGVPDSIRTTLLKACAYDPDDRYQSATELSDVLHNLLPTLPIQPLATAADRTARDGDTHASPPRRSTPTTGRIRGDVSTRGIPRVPSPEPTDLPEQPGVVERWAVPAMLGASALLLAIAAVTLYYLSGS